LSSESFAQEEDGRKPIYHPSGFVHPDSSKESRSAGRVAL